MVRAECTEFLGSSARRVKLDASKLMDGAVKPLARLPGEDVVRAVGEVEPAAVPLTGDHRGDRRSVARVLFSERARGACLATRAPVRVAGRAARDRARGEERRANRERGGQPRRERRRRRVGDVCAEHRGEDGDAEDAAELADGVRGAGVRRPAASGE
jgi:hypothetical protein